MIRDMETLGVHLPGGQATDSAAKGPSSRSGDERLGPGTAHDSYMSLASALGILHLRLTDAGYIPPASRNVII